MAFTLERRRKRRRRYYWAALVAVALLAAGYAVTRVQSAEQVQREYLDAAIDVAALEEHAAGRFTEVIVDLENLERPIMVDTLEEVRTEVSGLVTTAGEITAPTEGAAQRAHVLLSIAVARWDVGMSTTVDGILTLSETPLDQTGLALLTKGLVDLRVGDSAYEGFLEEIADVDTSILEQDFPEVHFIPPDRELVFEPTDIARRLFLTESLGITRNIAIADISLDPTPVGQESGIPVVPFSEGFDVFVTISNRGNIDIGQIQVELSLVSNEGDSFTADRVIELLQPGELNSLFFQDLPVDPGKIYEVIVVLPGQDDEPSDNRESFVFTMNEGE